MATPHAETMLSTPASKGQPILRLATSAVFVALFAWLAFPAFRWAFLDAVWTSDATACRQAAGACWAFIGQKYPLILFGLYPSADYWRPALVIVLFGILFVLSARRQLWGRWLAFCWLAGLVLGFWLMAGGLGLASVPTSQWGGLPLSMLLATVGLVLGYPLAVALALMRRSELAVLRWSSGILVEAVRGVPLIAMLFIAVMIVPLFLPPGTQVNKLFSAQAGLVLFAGAYMSEIVRAGMQVVGQGQIEAGKSLGIGFFPMQLTIVMPQVFRSTLPALVTTAIGFFQDTTLVIVIGVFDLLNAARAAAVDPAWLGFYVEAFLFVGLIYFLVSAAISRYGRWLETQLTPGGRGAPTAARRLAKVLPAR